jgi:hypothetical protein
MRGNDKWRGSFTAGEMARLNRVAGPLLISLGYDSGEKVSANDGP